MSSESATVIKRVLLWGLTLVGLLVIALGLNTWRQGSRQVEVKPLAPLAVDEAGAASSLAAAVRAKTVSGLLDPAGQAQEFAVLHAHLQSRYPLVHSKLEREVVTAHTLVYTWKGSDAKAKPIAFLAHQDVVPIAPGTETLWKKPPFSGDIAEGFVWGRGAWDNKGNLIAQLEALEALLKAGFAPKPTIYFVFGHDEEVGGRAGALAVVDLFKQRNIKLSFVLDEGLLVTEGLLPGAKMPVALIGVAEKGSMSVKLTAQAPPGHSSMPPAPGLSAIGMLAGALARVDAQPLPGGITGVAGDMFAALAPEMPLGQRMALSNLWLFGPLIEGMLGKSATTNALLRTTTALTIVNAGNKENVLPGRAEAVVNFRLLPGDTSEAILAHVKRLVADERIEVAFLGKPFEASPVSPATVPAYANIARSIREVFPGSVVVPGLMVAGTDGRHFDGLADAVYRFTPMRAGPTDLPRFHGTDERMATAGLADMIRFYQRLITLSAGP